MKGEGGKEGRKEKEEAVEIGREKKEGGEGKINNVLLHD